VEKTTDHGVRSALSFYLEQTESVQDLLGIGGEDGFRQQVGCGAIERECRCLFGVEPMLADGLLQNHDVLLPAT